MEPQTQSPPQSSLDVSAGHPLERDPLVAPTGHPLEREAELLHRVLFGAAAPRAVVRAYLDLHRQQPIASGAALPVDVASLVEAGLDLEALEFALRLRERDNSLTRKMHALCYLAEVRSDHLEHFVQRGESAGHPFWGLAARTLRSIWKLAKGRFLVWRHGVL